MSNSDPGLVAEVLKAHKDSRTLLEQWFDSGQLADSSVVDNYGRLVELVKILQRERNAWCANAKLFDRELQNRPARPHVSRAEMDAAIECIKKLGGYA